MVSHDVLRVRLNCLDHYQGSPTPLDAPIFGPRAFSSTQRGNLPQIPVIRVFGSTETGQKVCAHIHGAFPYLYIPYQESVEQSHVEAYISTLHHSIDHALAISYRRNPYANSRNAAFVAHISLVKGVPFFGYNVGYRYYLKVYLLNPLHMTRFADLLQQGAILKQVFQPYEAHQEYLLQWMCDFNLYGCAFIETKNPHFRDPVPSWETLEDVSHLFHDHSIPKERMLDTERYPRQSHCQLELDIRVEDIINRLSIPARMLHHSFIERLSSLENLPPEEKLVHSMAGLWKDETRRRKMRMGLTDPSSSPFPPEVLVSMSADPRHDGQGGWIHEIEFREAIDRLVEQEKLARGGGDLTFESFSSQAGEDDGVLTTFESVKELFAKVLERKWSTARADVDADNHVEYDSLVAGIRPAPIVDMNSITQVCKDDELDSDGESAKAQGQRQSVKQQEGTLRVPTSGAKTDGDTSKIESDAGPIGLAVTGRTELPENHFDGRLKRSATEGSQGPFKRVKFDDVDVAAQAPSGRFRIKDVRPPSRSSRVSPLPENPFQPPPAAQGVRPLDQFIPSQISPQSSSRGIRDTFLPMTSFDNKSASAPIAQCEKFVEKSKSSPRAGQSDLHLTSSNNSSETKSESTTRSPAAIRTCIHPTLAANYRTAFSLSIATPAVIFTSLPPSLAEVENTTFPSVIYQDAYYSNEKDVPERVREYAGQEFRLGSDTLPYLQPFDKKGSIREGKVHLPDKTSTDLANERRKRLCTLETWEFMRPPPSRAEVEQWLQEDAPPRLDDSHLEIHGPSSSSQIKRKNRPASELSQIDGPTQRHKHGFKYSQKKAITSVQHVTGYMSTMSLEVHINSRDHLAPDPEHDEIAFVSWRIADERVQDQTTSGIVLLNKDDDEDLVNRIQLMAGNNVHIAAENNELDLLNAMVDIVRGYDPDILTGYEVHNNSWGYLIERARLSYEFNLPDEFSRMKSQSHGRFGKDNDRWGFTHTSTVRITGRHTINIWRAMRSELNLLQYNMENVVFHLLHKRIPHYQFRTLTRWYQSGKPGDLAKVLDYFMSRTKLDLEILDANELIPRVSEQARLLGVDFFSVFSRGSQFKVESLMFRIAKPESFVLVSPSRKQVGAQNALECLPLVMEPQSAFYNSPLLVLDFQSLYPSVMIAYNYCYSTCLGRITEWRGTNKLGFADFKRAPGLLELAKDKINVSPNGMMYVKPAMRKSLLAKMLGEILETRVMVKSGMKTDKDDKTLQQLLNNRQLALKLIANVTYGYTSASFSGRMPCAEIADSIVQTGRETLEKAIAFIHSVERWGAEVVYGDTDSLFVYLKGRTRDAAFTIGEEIAKAVTDMNPRPIKLKFEKVYHPCVLLAKKRYVGFKYESPQQTEPEFDAKGIETVRRDGTPAEQKIEEKALKLLFRTSDLSQVKSYFQAQCAKIMTGRISVQDFCFAKEVKLGTYADKGPAPPGALIATRRMLRDPRSEPQYGERIPYVVVAGGPGAKLWERCVEPERLINDEHAELDADYYINKNLIPPLERIFNLVGANVRQWYDEMPKVQRIRMLGGQREDDDAAKKNKRTMESYMGSSLCLACRARLAPFPAHLAGSELPLCLTCNSELTSRTLIALRQKIQTVEAEAKDLQDVCRSCSNLAPNERTECKSRDCPVFYSRVKAETRLHAVKRAVGTVLARLEDQESGKEKFKW